jgi:hypothetical protein
MQHVKYLGTFVISYCALVILFLLLVTVSCLIPSSALKNNIGKTIPTLKSEGIYPSVGISWRKITLDNFTESLMINTAFSVESHDALKSALVNVRYDGKTNNSDQISNLEKLYKNKDIQPVGYERYWHGYLFYLRPLLVIFPYSVIRIILSVALYGLTILFSVLAWKKLGKKTTIAFLLGLLVVDFFFIGKSMQFSDVFLVGLIASIYILLNSQKKINLYLVFFVTGAFTSFVDLLTAPLVSLGMILIVTYKLKKTSVKDLFLYSLIWSIGYIVLWASKWIIVEGLFTHGAITTAFNEITDRTVHKPDPNFSHFNAVRLNVLQLQGYDKRNKIVWLISAILLFIPFIRYFTFPSKKIKELLSLFVPWIFIAAIPYGWYLMAANHSYLHVWYTYRDQFMTVVAVFVIIMEFFNWGKLEKDIGYLRNRFGLSKKSAVKSYKK